MSDQLLLTMPGLDRVHHAPFVMPAPGASDRKLRRALERMNKIRLTIDQFDRGVEVFERTARGQQGHAANVEREAALIEFCAAEGIEPAEVAAHAILFRRNPILEALGDGLDIKASNPAGYASCVTEPIEIWRYIWDDDEDGAA